MYKFYNLVSDLIKVSNIDLDLASGNSKVKMSTPFPITGIYIYYFLHDERIALERN